MSRTFRRLDTKKNDEMAYDKERRKGESLERTIHRAHGDMAERHKSKSDFKKIYQGKARAHARTTIHHLDDAEDFDIKPRKLPRFSYGNLQSKI